jgi:hypothetical protein
MTEATCQSIESQDGLIQNTSGNQTTQESTSTDTVPDTRRLLPDIEMLPTVLDGLNLLIQKLDSSSSENNLTGIAHHAHSTIRVIPDTLPKTRTPESTSTRLLDGLHQPSNGKTRSRELNTTDTAQVTERP